jgi:hypothetical protein
MLLLIITLGIISLAFWLCTPFIIAYLVKVAWGISIPMGTTEYLISMLILSLLKASVYTNTERLK